jgi:hypothetical protein
MEQRAGLFLEEALAVVLGWEALGEPVRKASRFPAIEVEDRPLGQVLPYTVPVERGLATDMQSFEAPLEQDEARMQGGRIVWAAIHAAGQPLQPAGTDIVDGKVGRDPEGGEVIGGQRRPGRQVGIELV